ncbi:hypothetical protein K490DRAFT_75916 [Saccharata proteae CBS 121410]|uniref:WW domain-containing protein n=1 Tax=Saccharata proteae CBS 121410 TaxID=1314787 RepID=A0A9P4HMK8_9PEZI|nr:hypothetical protein K490DRAFT_75916 [Saccharata proteae CBS 121410]
MADPTPAQAPLSPDAGPTDPHLPELPSGWIAQWDGTSRKYYYVQISTGHSQWDKPTSEEPVGTRGSRSNTPANAIRDQPIMSPDGNGMARGPDGSATYAPDGKSEDYSEDRGLGSTAMNMLMHKQSGHNQSGLGGIASSFLGGGSHGGSQSQASGHSSSGLVGQLASGLLGSGKPHGQQQQQQQQQAHGTGSSSHQQSGLGGMLGGMLGGSHGSQNYGYSSSGTSGTYSGTAPSAQYQPQGSHVSSTHSPSAQYGTQSYAQTPSYGQSGPNQYGAPTHTQGGHPPQHTSSFGQQNMDFPPPPQQHHQSYGSPANAHTLASAPYDQYGQNSSTSFPPPPPPSQNHGGYGAAQPPHGSAVHASYGQTPMYGQESHSQTGYGGQQGYGAGQQQQQQHGNYAAYSNASRPPQPGW